MPAALQICFMQKLRVIISYLNKEEKVIQR